MMRRPVVWILYVFDGFDWLWFASDQSLEVIRNRQLNLSDLWQDSKIQKV